MIQQATGRCSGGRFNTAESPQFSKREEPGVVPIGEGNVERIRANRPDGLDPNVLHLIKRDEDFVSPFINAGGARTTGPEVVHGIDAGLAVLPVDGDVVVVDSSQVAGRVFWFESHRLFISGG